MVTNEHLGEVVEHL